MYLVDDHVFLDKYLMNLLAYDIHEFRVFFRLQDFCGQMQTFN